MNAYRLFGMPGSLYTAKARSYLIKQRVDFEEAIPNSQEIQETIVRSPIKKRRDSANKLKQLLYERKFNPRAAQ